MRVVTSKQLDNTYLWDFLAVQWLRLHASTVRGMGFIPGQGIKIMVQPKKKSYLWLGCWDILYFSEKCGKDINATCGLDSSEYAINEP